MQHLPDIGLEDCRRVSIGLTTKQKTRSFTRHSGFHLLDSSTLQLMKLTVLDECSSFILSFSCLSMHQGSPKLPQVGVKPFATICPFILLFHHSGFSFIFRDGMSGILHLYNQRQWKSAQSLFLTNLNVCLLQMFCGNAGF